MVPPEPDLLRLHHSFSAARSGFFGSSLEFAPVATETGEEGCGSANVVRTRPVGDDWDPKRSTRNHPSEWPETLRNLRTERVRTQNLPAPGGYQQVRVRPRTFVWRRRVPVSGVGINLPIPKGRAASGGGGSVWSRFPSSCLWRCFHLLLAWRGRSSNKRVWTAEGSQVDSVGSVPLSRDCWDQRLVVTAPTLGTEGEPGWFSCFHKLCLQQEETGILRKQTSSNAVSRLNPAPPRPPPIPRPPPGCPSVSES